jgi:hypothetical protein
MKFEFRAKADLMQEGFRITNVYGGIWVVVRSDERV